MEAQEFVRVGKVKDAHGIKGEIFIALFAGEAAWLGKLKEARLVVETESPESAQAHPAPATEPKVLQVKSVRLHKNGLIIKSPDVTDRNAAEALKGRLLEIPSDFLVSEPGEALYLSEIKGFRVITAHKGEVGTVSGFSSNTAQDLLVVTTPWGEFEIPFVEAFVEDIDFEKKEMHLNLPEGLLGELEGDEVQ
jgi:16S rRNA processing protein RimM